MKTTTTCNSIRVRGIDWKICQNEKMKSNWISFFSSSFFFSLHFKYPIWTDSKLINLYSIDQKETNFFFLNFKISYCANALKMKKPKTIAKNKERNTKRLPPQGFCLLLYGMNRIRNLFPFLFGLIYVVSCMFVWCDNRSIETIF